MSIVTLKRICHMTSVHPRDDVRIFYKMCGSLYKEGYEVHLIVADGMGDKLVNGITIHDVGVSSGRIKRILLTTNRVLKKALSIDAEVYHFHDPELINIGLKLRKRHKLVVYDVHEDLPRQIISKSWIPKILRGAVSRIAEFIENNAAQNFSALIVATPFIRERFLKNTKICVNVNNFPIINEFSKYVDWNSRKNRACYVGAIAEVRGIVPLVDAMDYIDIPLHIAGKFSHFTLKNKIEKKSGWSKIIYHGFLNRAEIPDLLRNSKVGIVTLMPIINYLDSLPIKMFEYMAAGLPVIVSDFPSWRSIIEKYECGICVDPNNPKEIAQAIGYLIDNPKEAEALGQNGRKAVGEFLNWSIEEKKLFKVYQNLLNGSFRTS